MAYSVGHQAPESLSLPVVESVINYTAYCRTILKWRSTQLQLACFHAAVFALVVVQSLCSAHAAEVSHIGIQQKVIVICAKFTDMTPQVTNAADWVSRLETAVNGYYHKATFGKTTFKFEFPTDVGRSAGAPPMLSGGWFEITVRPYERYVC